jgi:hypothetical protein
MLCVCVCVFVSVSVTHTIERLRLNLGGLPHERLWGPWSVSLFFFKPNSQQARQLFFHGPFAMAHE